MKIIKPISLFLLLAIASVAYFFNSVGENHAQTNLADEKVEMTTPEIALKEFWRATYSGNEKRLLEISPFSDVNEFDMCPKEEVPAPSEFISYKDPNKVFVPGEYIRVDSKNTKPPFSSKKLTDNIKTFANYVNAVKLDWDRIKILDERIYKDEALLTVKIADYQNESAKGQRIAFAFKNIDNEWRLISNIDRGIFPYESEIEYARPRSCY